ncbi:hypothetical protein JRO89_XS06G0154800 [Xanthoceras sorbifolium]|uniref:Uncharacterized protein n=1 Tax=Xanthoceras sorbifolium TaxID=99658 RepID=A0ABQ8HYE5_9ROSI|nr:hypothetical protein JRO89_XS06G0154800 [Xanthoceras sorbifolium]
MTFPVQRESDKHEPNFKKMEIPPAPISSCSKEHQRIYKEWFDIADSDGDGRITGNDATKFFAMSKLSRQELKQVWGLADSKRQGFLDFAGFVTAMQLVSLAQAGHELTSNILKNGAHMENIEPPSMEGLDAFATKNKGSTTNSEPAVNGCAQSQTLSSAHWFTSKSSKTPASSVTSIIDGLKRLYIEKLKPLEVTYRFNDFESPLLTNSDFDAKPMVMLLGQYSTGKTTFIKHLLRCDYPGAHIGPEPTTDRFVVVMSGPDERSIPGNTIAVHADMPFSGLTTFGGAFLSKFECSQMPHPLLDQITFVDTPGVLSGEKQRTQRSYDFTGVISWFAAKCDLILLLFDPHKLDISDEFKRVISSLRGNDDKIRVVLNKADQVDTQQLMRVYGALMWSLGKVLNTPEVVRVYIGSFNDKPINEAVVGEIGRELFEKEQDDLLMDLINIPKKACDRRINEFVKRARAAKIHAYIISHLKKEMPSMMGKAKAQQRLIDNLEDEFAKVQREFHLPAGDFPNVEHFREVLNGYSIDKFEKLKPKMIQAVDDMLAYEIPELLKNFKNPYE